MGRGHGVCMRYFLNSQMHTSMPQLIDTLLALLTNDVQEKIFIAIQ